MRLTLDVRSVLIAAVPEIGLARIRATAGRKYAHKRQQVLCDWALQSYMRVRTHKANPEASSFSCTALRNDLHIKNFKPLLRGLYYFTERNGRYSRERAQTKQYCLHPHVRMALSAVMQGTAPLTVLNVDTGLPVTRSSVPNNGIPAGLDDRLFVPSVMVVPMVQIETAIHRLIEAGADYGSSVCADIEKPDGCTMGDALQYLYTCRKWISSPLGGVPNMYKVTSTGRLGPDGFHVIQFPAVVRRLLFDGSGLSDYDIESAHFNIFRSRARSLGFLTPYADEYVAQKAHHHRRWMSETGHVNVADFKATATSWLNGGSLSESVRTETGKRLGSTVVTILKEDTFASALRQEARDGMVRIVAAMATEATGNTETTYTNVVGATIRVQQKAHGKGAYRQVDFGRLCAHVLTGYEQWAIREVCSIAVGLEVIIYDGLIAGPGQERTLTEHILHRSTEKLGFPLELRMKEAALTAPELGDASNF
ncbi:MAG TPA: hypothetical protein VNU46_02990 [Gemmatimonadaceae bacterium]|jgi:hypothetical protein|nr:hypothetical protein [Gemmatimonadaceae bacterium]